MRRFIKLSSETQSAAAYLAARGLTGKIGDPLPMGLSSLALREINEHPVLFRLAVHMAWRADASCKNRSRSLVLDTAHAVVDASAWKSAMRG